MIARELPSEKVVLLLQEDHADLAAQFAAHWGNAAFSRLERYGSMLFATTYHDSHYRELEAGPPMHPDKGRPYGHRELPPSPARWDALRANLDWLRQRDPYASLIVSMHHTGLLQSRYGVVSTQRGGSGYGRTMRPEVATTVEAFEAEQRREREALGLAGGEDAAALWFNFRLLQVFDLLSLYFCCDGYAGEAMVEERIGPVPVRPGGEEAVELQLLPVGPNAVRLTPYPFDCSPLPIAVAGRVMAPEPSVSAAEGREAYYRATRTVLSWELVG
jgi:hypothetical protein